MYRCQMPFCDYVCDSKSQIDEHHIIPSSMGGSNNGSNIIQLCPNCHARIYVEGISSGRHSVRNTNSIVLLGKVYSTGGHLIEYRFIDDEDTHYGVIT